ncbi:hypothetical protein BVG16_13660 [Paenibacillus selenitireducens]|uniref:Uncharacterized protein n=1 Tax=Paenibacillus selenitireducens TaxID=1324314 RepID=A0A1T2XCE2_9BACL|nr:hypothetical protein [Paenibacillus selenitireducens]OPA77495.1 hypothetical protein BVG16_13660 [Paenibacillus selenitireducens]
MNPLVNSKAMLLIHRALTPIIHSGKKIDRIHMHVSQNSELSSISYIETQFGDLEIIVNPHIHKGFCYLIESPISRGGIGFNWVSKPKKMEV